MKRPNGRLLLCGALALVALAAVSARSAQAGSRELVNGFDNDYHCTSSADPTDGVCKWFNAAIPWIRGGAPDPAKPVLVLDRDGTTDPDCASACNNADSAHSIELDTALGVAFPGIAKQLVDPRSPEFAALPLDVAHYSAIVVASNVNCGGCDLNNLVSQPDSEALKARAAEILNFFRNGGGVMAMSGGETSGGVPAAAGRNAMTRGGSGTVAQCTNYYAFLPLPVTCSIYGGDVLTTPAGNAIGLTDDLYGFSHNSFEQPPAGSPLQVGAVLDTEVIDAASRGISGDRAEHAADAVRGRAAESRRSRPWERPPPAPATSAPPIRVDSVPRPSTTRSAAWRRRWPRMPPAMRVSRFRPGRALSSSGARTSRAIRRPRATR